MLRRRARRTPVLRRRARRTARLPSTPSGGASTPSGGAARGVGWPGGQGSGKARMAATRRCFASLLPSLRKRVRPSSFPCFTATRVIRTTAHLHFLHLSSNRHRTCLSEAPAHHPWYTDCRYNRQRRTRAHRQVSKHWHRRASKHRRLSRRCWTPCRRRRGKA